MECPQCHTIVSTGAAFCPNCGASLAPAASAVPPAAGFSSGPPVDPLYPPAAPVTSGLSTNAAAAISYITFIPAVIFLLVEPYNRNPFVRFHSIQSIGLTIVAFIIDIVLRILLFPFGLIMYSLMQSLISLGLFIVWIIVILKASRGEWYKLPVIGDIAMKQSRR